ncbi:MAG: inositol monophosphatase family protein [Myxococcaceae bacterium]
MLRAAAEEGARAAGRILAERFDGERTVEFKGAIDLVTDADRAAEAALLAYLRGRFPGHAILAEESGLSEGVSQDHHGYNPEKGGGQGFSAFRWLVDPLDGTTNYAHRVPHFCVSVAVEGPGGLLAGVVFDPLRDELFSAGRGQGAWLNGRKLEVSSPPGLERALVCTGFPYDVRERPEVPVGLFDHFIRKVQGLRRMGSAALDLAYVAAGRFDGFFEVGLKPWDIAAGALLVEEAGGVVTRFDGAKLELERGEVLAAGQGLHSALRQETAAVLAALSRAGA